MSADLHIHVFTDDFTEKDYAKFQSNTLGSKFFNPTFGSGGDKGMDLFEKCGETPNIWIGSVSWLKAALFEDGETFIPTTVNEVHEIISEDFPIITPVLIERIMKAFDLKNTTGYQLANKEEVREFLENHIGKKAFTISW